MVVVMFQMKILNLKTIMDIVMMIIIHIDLQVHQSILLLKQEKFIMVKIIKKVF